MTKKSYRRYSPEFKREAIKRACDEGVMQGAGYQYPPVSTMARRAAFDG